MQCAQFTYTCTSQDSDKSSRSSAIRLWFSYMVGPAGDVTQRACELDAAFPHWAARFLPRPRSAGPGAWPWGRGVTPGQLLQVQVAQLRTRYAGAPVVAPPGASHCLSLERLGRSGEMPSRVGPAS